MPRFLASYVNWSGHHIFESHTFVIGLGLSVIFFILFPNYMPCPNSSIATSSESSVNKITPVHIGTFICSAYYSRNGYTVNSFKVNDIGRMLDPKQWVSS